VYLASLAAALLWKDLGRSLCGLSVGCLAVSVLGLRYALASLGWLSLAWWFPAAQVLALCVWIWALVVLHRFGRRLKLLIEGRCPCCEYMLRGLPENRCPECGREFVAALSSQGRVHCTDQTPARHRKAGFLSGLLGLMKSRRAKVIVLASSAIAVVTIVTVLWVRHALLMKDVVLLVPEGWADLAGPVEVMTTAKKDVLFVRRARQAVEDGETTSDLALTDWQYYRCDIALHNTERIGAGAWRDEDGRITSFHFEPIKNVRVRPVVGSALLEVGGVAVPLAAAMPCGYFVSPSGRLLAVPTAKPQGSLGGAWLGGYTPFSSKQHYHQTARLTDPVIVGRALPIPMVTRLNGRKPTPGKDQMEAIIWSADERFVVYAGSTSLCIVRVKLDGD